jgi:hypothetical protein
MMEMHTKQQSTFTAPKPTECPHCEYDRRFPGFEGGGWMQQDNNGPIVPCPLCNDDGSYLPKILGTNRAYRDR